jgi:hypothetical protein
MIARHALLSAITGWAAAVLCACSTTRALDRSASYGEPTRVRVEDVPVKGFSVHVVTRKGDDVEGELLASDEGTVCVLESVVAAPDRTVCVAWSNIEEVRVALLPGERGIFAGWTAFGTLSTISHGGFLILSAPIWLLTGISASFGSDPAITATARGPTKLNEFARFPQGLPPGWAVRRE